MARKINGYLKLRYYYISEVFYVTVFIGIYLDFIIVPAFYIKMFQKWIYGYEDTVTLMGPCHVLSTWNRTHCGFM